MISSGFTDDLFPANEATRYYNRTRAQYPNTPLSLFFGDFGHQRAANKTDVRAALNHQGKSLGRALPLGHRITAGVERHLVHADMPRHRRNTFRWPADRR